MAPRPVLRSANHKEHATLCVGRGRAQHPHDEVAFARQISASSATEVFNATSSLPSFVASNASHSVISSVDQNGFKSSSPAFLMHQEAVRQLFAEGRIRRIEFYSKLMEWHTRWSDEARTMYHINYHRWAVVSTARRFISYPH